MFPPSMAGNHLHFYVIMSLTPWCIAGSGAEVPFKEAATEDCLLLGLPTARVTTSLKEHLGGASPCLLQ